MNDDTHDTGTSDFDTDERAGSVEAGVALVLCAEDNGDWRPVAEWLARHPEAAGEVRGFLDVQDKLRPVATPVAPPLPGTSLGGIALGEEIGSGAMGVVFRGFDSALKRDVAVKMVRAVGAFSDTELARLRVEGEAVAKLDHPNIVRVLSFGETNGVPYIVMPLMTGGTLAKRLKERGQLPETEAATIVRDIALGVHHAHQRGLIHRDLKPANILLDAAGTSHIADFGLARQTDATTSAGIAGTFAYMAPEQSRGGQQLTTVVDIYALGVILFELLTGRVPYTGDVASIVQQLTDPQVQPPPVRKFRPDADGDLEAICLKCLEKHRGARYPSAREVADDLIAYLDRRPVKARAPGVWDWVRQMARVRPDPNADYSWPVVGWFGAIQFVSNVVVYAMVRADAPALGVWGANTGCAVAMVVVLWWYMLRRFRQLPVTERHSLVIASGQIIAYFPLMLAFVPFSLTVPARDAMGIYPPLTAVCGVSLFALGSTNWSRFFPIGLGMMCLVPVTTRWPEESPLVFGCAVAAVMWYWAIVKEGSFVRTARAGEKTDVA